MLGKTTMTSITAKQIAQRLRDIHFDGQGCGTHGSNACSNCFGPSPMNEDEIAREIVALINKG